MSKKDTVTQRYAIISIAALTMTLVAFFTELCTDNPKTAIRYVSGAFLSGNRQGKKIWMVFVRKQHNKRATFGHSHQKLARECSFRPPPPRLGRASTESGIVKPVSGPRTPGSGAYASEAVRYDVLIRSITSQFSSSIIL